MVVVAGRLPDEGVVERTGLLSIYSRFQRTSASIVTLWQ